MGKNARRNNRRHALLSAIQQLIRARSSERAKQAGRWRQPKKNPAKESIPIRGMRPGKPPF